MSRIRQTKIATPSSPPANTEELYYATAGPGVGTPAALMAIDENGVTAMLAHFTVLDYRLIKVLLLISGTTYTPSNGTRALYVECMGGGGAGGGSATAAASGGAGGGGGGGSYSTVWLTGAQVKSSFVYAIGASGAAGAAGNNPGGNGGDTTFDSASVCTGKGGTGGGGSAAGTALAAVSAGGAGGVAGVGDGTLVGAPGKHGILLNATGTNGAYGGDGGNGFLGGGAALGARAQGTGVSATANNGGGGSGGVVINNGAAVAGGAGGSGRIRIWEFA